MANRADIERWLKDGTLNFMGGVDSGSPASDLDPNQSFRAFNATCRGGQWTHRPAWKQRKLSFSSAAVEEAFQNGFFQTGKGYNGARQDSLMSSQGGRQFKIDIDSTPGTLTTTTGNFTIPADGATVTVAIVDGNMLNSQSTTIKIGSYDFELISVDTAIQITVKNHLATAAGVVVASGARVTFVNTWNTTEITPTEPFTVQTTAAFTIPGVGSSVTVDVTNSTKATLDIPAITIGGYHFDLVSVPSSASITVRNSTPIQVGVVVANMSDVVGVTNSRNSPDLLINWSVTAENYWILQDNQSLPVIYDGTRTYRSDLGKSQIPVGNVMCYSQGRLIVALQDGISYLIGDLVYGSSGTAASLNHRDAILYFTETTFLSGGGAPQARVFNSPGKIMSMTALAQPDTQLGQGPMIIGTPDVMFTINLPFDRASWPFLANPLQTTVPISGPTGQESTVIFNSDLAYRAFDGERLYRQARRDFDATLANTPISNEINDRLNFDSALWFQWGSAAVFDNRLLQTIEPQMTSHGVYHRGLIVLDANVSSKLRKRLPPVWEGVWTGLRILKILTISVNNVARCFMYVLNDQSRIELWELSTADRFDNETDLIEWRVELASYGFQDLDRFKKLKLARFILTGIRGTVTGQVDFRSDEAACYHSWQSFSRCAADRDCGPDECTGPITYRERTAFPVRLKEPPDTFDAITKRKVSTGYEFQVRLTFTGSCSLKQFRLYAIDEPENLGIEKQTET